MREESLGWSDSLEEILGNTDFNNISSLGTNVSKLISWVNDAACELSLDGIHQDLGVLDFLLNEVAVPSSNAEVVDGETLGGSVVEEANLVGDVHANWVSN